jgi:shikimate kinase
MNLIFIYGPPATGKLTIATELAELTGYTLFHNHLSLNLAREIFPDFDDKLFNLVHEIRLDVFSASAKYDRNLIFTNVYSGDDDDKHFVRRVVESVEQHNGNVRFVQLTAPLEVLLSRVDSESRKHHKKITDGDKLKVSLSRYDMNVGVAYDNILTLDTSVLQPADSARKIVETFKLATL